MKSRWTKHVSKASRRHSGMALVETIIALLVLLVAAVGVMSLAVIALTGTENQGHLQARVSEYAQDKMEQLLGLAFCDATTDTTVLPANPAGGTGLAGCPVPIVNPATGAGGNGGSANPAAPVAGYVDYLDASGNLLVSAGGAAPAGWYYMRVWQISVPAGTNTIKQITVTARTSGELGGAALKPQATVTALKTYPF
jgi:hypothetical protein